MTIEIVDFPIEKMSFSIAMVSHYQRVAIVALESTKRCEVVPGGYTGEMIDELMYFAQPDSGTASSAEN